MRAGHGQSPPQVLRNIRDLITQGLLDEALDVLAQQVKLRPSDAEVWYLFGVACERQGAVSRAVFCYRKASEVDPTWALPWFKVGSLLSAKVTERQYAVAALEHAVQLAPGWVVASESLCAGMWRIGRRYDAYAAAASLAARRGDDPVAAVLAGSYAFAVGQFSAASNFFRRTLGDIARLPLWALVALARWSSATWQGDIFRLLVVEVQKREVDEKTSILIARSAFRIGEESTAKHFIDKVISKNPKNRQANILLADIYVLNHEWSLAATHLHRAIAGRLGDVRRLHLLAELNIRVGRSGTAEIILRGVVASSPDDPRAWGALLVFLLSKGCDQEAASIIERRCDEDIIHFKRTLKYLDDIGFRQGFVAAIAKNLNAESAGRLGPALAGLQHLRQLEAINLTTHDRPAAFEPRAPEVRSVWRDTVGEVGGHVAVVAAVIRREMRTRFSRDKLGYLWAFIEPLILVALFYGIFMAMGRMAPFGTTMLTFLVSGLVPWYMFQNTMIRVQTAARQNAPLLYFPQVKPIDLFAARAILEFGTLTIVCFILMAAAYSLEPFGEIKSPIGVLFALCLAWLMGSGMGLCVAAAMTWFNWVEKVVSYALRLWFFTSGIFFMANELPSEVRDVLQFNPMFHVIDAMRAALFYDYQAEGSAMTVTLVVAVVSLFLGLLGESLARQRFHL
ncbi:MAG: ABC transporter permease [Rhodospirillaceae bacterium]